MSKKSEKIRAEIRPNLDHKLIQDYYSDLLFFCIEKNISEINMRKINYNVINKCIFQWTIILTLNLFIILSVNEKLLTALNEKEFVEKEVIHKDL